MNHLTITLVLVVLASFTRLHAQGDPQLRISPVLQSRMVIQQNKPFKVWGDAPAGSQVHVQADWLTDGVKVIADTAGRFMAILDVPSVQPGDFTPHRLQLTGAGSTTVLDSVLIGEVWICAGQSNMQFSLKEDLHASGELPKAHHPHLRLFSAALNFSAEPIDSIGGRWQVCTPATAGDFSAVGYYMGRELLDSLNLPIGMIFTGIGASAAQAYVPRAVLAADPVLDTAYLRPYLNSPKSMETVDGGFSFEKVTRPYLLYNALIHPFANLSVRGFTWYQGESNHLEADSYTRLIQAMVGAWRTAFQQGTLPFYFVQIAPYDHEKKDPALADDAFFREAQARIATLANTAMVVSTDIGQTDNLHPTNKRPLGERLARTALNRAYGRLHVAHEGPRMRHIDYHAGKVVVYFSESTLTDGLLTSDGKPPACFYVAGSDRVFHPAAATISGHTVVLQSKNVKRPIAVRYAFFNFPETNLANGAGLPALPFRTDNWPK